MTVVVAPPGDARYAAATAVFNLSAPARPIAAMTACSVADVRDAIKHARTAGLPVRVHTTGHAAAAVRPMDDCLLIRTALDEPVEIDATMGVARIPAGARWGTVVGAATAHGLTLPHGSSATVGAVGYLLRGGLSLYGRRTGLAVNSVLAVELVTADGQLRRVDAYTDPELFWALRGGGGGFGVVTALEVRLFAARRVITGAAYWPAEHAPAVLAAWHRWTLDAPWDATTSVTVMNLPPMPNVPPMLAGRTMLSVEGAIVGGRENGLGEPATDAGGMDGARDIARALLGPLRGIAEPVLDTWQETSSAAVLDAHMDPADPVPFVGDHMLLTDPGEAGLAEFWRMVGPDSGSPFVLAGLRQLGGAYAEEHPGQGLGALDHLEARFSYAGSGVPMGGVTPEDLRAHCVRVRDALRRWDSGRTAPSFVEDFRQPQRHLRPDQIYAADRVRLRVDPDGLFRGDIAPNATAL